MEPARDAFKAPRLILIKHAATIGARARRLETSMDLNAWLSDDRKELTLQAGEGRATLTAQEVEEAIRMLAEHRGRMEPPPSTEPGPLQQEYMLQDLWVYGNPSQHRLGLHILTREMGWTMYAVPLPLVERVVANIRSGADATIKEQVAPPPVGTTRQ